MRMLASDELSAEHKNAGGLLPEPQFCYSGGVKLAVYCQGDPSKPNIVLVHGYPDNSGVWNLLADYLVDQFYLIRYDVRGAGNSAVPADQNAYRLGRLQEDLEAVTAQFCSQPKFHLVGHDWGSVQSWESVSCPRFQHKILSYTSISGPCLDHMGHWVRQRLREKGGVRSMVKQFFRSWYIWFFHLPLLPAFLWRFVLGRYWSRSLYVVEGIETHGDIVAERAQRRRDGVHGMALYRANCLPCFREPRQRTSEVPVQLVIPTHDRFLGADLYSGISEWAPNTSVHHVSGGHWLPLSHPEELATLIVDFTRTVSLRA